MYYIFPGLEKAMGESDVTINNIADVIDNDVLTVERKLKGELELDINDAMKINKNLFADIPFKKLFKKRTK